MAVKMKTVFFCQECGYESSKWMGQCPGCRQWNTMVEETVKPATKASVKTSAKEALQVPQTLSQIVMEEEDRADTHIDELNRVLGGGLVRGSLILVGGDPGIGKSTLLLQVAGNLSADKREILYISGEESLRQIKLRANRIGNFSDSLKFMCETSLSNIEETVLRQKPEVIIIDSIQTMYNESVSSAPGSVSQVRESTSVLLRIAKSLNVTVFIVGHVTKEGQVAGPRVLEHMVDTVLYFEGDRHASYRILRAVKNRFGSTNEIGVFEMQERGLVEVTNPSEFMLDGRPENASGSIVTCSVEGTRPILLEIQALVCHTNFGFPRRSANGTDYNRVNILMAVLEKRIGLSLGDFDAYVNLAGGMKIAEPSLDLAICLALISSFKNKPVSDSIIAFGEVGLSGEVRSVNMAESRVMEAKKLGFKTCIVPKAQAGKLKESCKDIEIIGVASVSDAMELLK
jgi:DNA repair protein RadA/Sms